MFAIASMPIYAQTFSGKIGPSFNLGGYPNDDALSIGYGLDISFGVRSHSNYFGVGIEPGAITDHYSDDGYYYAENFTGFNMPIYAEYTYEAPYSGYVFDAKIGPSIYKYDDASLTGFFLDIKPLGYRFDKHSSVGAGYRFIKYNNAKNHSFALQYTYTF